MLHIEKRSYRSNKLKISAPTWNEKFELPDGSYFVSDIQGYFEYIIKNNEIFYDNPPIIICINEIENSITFKT